MNYSREIKKAFIVGFVLWVIFLVLNVLNGGEFPKTDRLAINFVYTMVYTFVIYLSNAALFIFLDKKFAEERFSLKRLIIGFSSSIPLTVLMIFNLRLVDEVLISKISFGDFLKTQTFGSYFQTIITTIIISLIIHVIYLYKTYQETRLKEQKVIAGTANARFESLKNQIDPHFLFNSLNVLSSLIEENPDNAQKFTASLSKIYRYVLEQKDKELVSLEEELTFAKTYMNLLKMRFENSISYDVVSNVEIQEAKVVPLSLQLLLENTIKHNIVSENKPLSIKIYIEKNYLVVENNLQKKEVLSDRRGVGLQNIVNRYALISERKVLVEQTNEFFKVKIPILTKQIVTMETQAIYNENTSYIRAKERVEKLKGFYGNLISYCVVIPILIFVNLSTSNFQWFWFPMLGWGLGLTFHALETFGVGKNWEERKIQEILNKDKNNNTKWN
ncbi:2TM domain-containing protein [Flavobacterium sp.]|uniref:2TM domain-containing protein n=1 Tax=Flavobacterium sp. TaxID=239 RepID=UPI0035AF8AE2